MQWCTVLCCTLRVPLGLTFLTVASTHTQHNMAWCGMVCDMDGMGQVMAAKAVGGRPVLPFAATYCQSPPMPCYSNGTFPVEPWAVEMLMTMPYEEGAAGVVMCKAYTNAAPPPPQPQPSPPRHRCL